MMYRNQVKNQIYNINVSEINGQLKKHYGIDIGIESQYTQSTINKDV